MTVPKLTHIRKGGDVGQKKTAGESRQLFRETQT
jgi:hypothetical protein